MSNTHLTKEQLEAQINQATSAQERILYLGELAWHVRATDRDRAIQLCDEVVAASQEDQFTKEPFKYGVAVGLILQGYLDFRSLAYVDALSKGEEAVRILEKLEELIWLPRAYNIASMCFGTLGIYHKCIYYLEKQYEVSVKTNDFESQASALHNTGTVYMNMEEGDLVKSREKFEQSILAFEKAGKDDGIARACSNIARIELLNNNPEEALASCARGLPKSVENELMGLQAMILVSMGEAKAMLSLNEEAEQTFFEALDIANRFKAKDTIFDVNLKLAKLYFQLSEYEEVPIYLDKALEVAKSSDNFVSQSEVYVEYTALYEIQGNVDAALEMAKVHMQVKEQGYKMQRQQQAEQFELLKRLELDAKNVEIFQLKNQKLEQMVQTRTQALAEKTADLQRTNNELELASQRKDAFLATMSHELRTPLNVVITRTQALQMGIYGSTTDNQKKVLQGIHDSGEHLLRLINDVLDISKITSGEVKLYLGTYVINDIIAQCVSMIEPVVQTKKLHMSVKLLPSQTTIKVDERRIKQALINLLSNAVKFTEEGGEIELSVRVTKDDMVEICVADTGIGISKSDQENLFNPFTQVDNRLNRDYEGTGLGLALVKQFTELHMGHVHLESEPGKGSKFFIRLPIIQKSSESMSDAT